MMTCKEIRNHLSAYLDEEINENLKKQIDDHITICPYCKSVLNNGYAVKNYMRGLSKLKTSKEFEIRLREKITQELLGKGSFVKDWKRPFGYINNKPVIGLATAAAIVIALVMMNNYSSNNEKSEIPISTFENKIMNSQKTGRGTNPVADKANKQILNREPDLLTNPTGITDSTRKSAPKLYDGKVIPVKGEDK